MAAATPRPWNETDIPAVPADALADAFALWLARERQGMVLVGRAPIETLETIEAAVIAMHECPAKGLSIVLRLRGLVAAIGARRFRHLLRAENAEELGRLVAAAAELRLNPAWGMSPVRLVWSMAGVAHCRRESEAA
jgi:hypothetical protein